MSVLTRPKYNRIDQLVLPKIEIESIDDHIQMYSINSEYPDVIQLDFIFDAGRWSENQRQVASATATLLKEGTLNLTAYQIASKIESYGATIRSRSGMDYTTISLFCLKKHAIHLIDIIFEILQNSSFEEQELELYKTRNKAGLRIDLANNEIYCHREFTELIFGANHPYGYNKTEKDFDALKRHHLVDHFKTYSQTLKYVFLAGKYDDALIGHIKKCCKHFVTSPPASISKGIKLNPAKTKKVDLNINNGLQASIKIGREVVTSSIEQRHLQFIVNTIFGGFFGSRLMKSIREEKGYTYNIYSHIDHLKHHSFFGIHTEVGTEFIDATISEIQLQAKMLRKDLVKTSELSLVKNYLMGSLLMQFDGILKTLHTTKQIILTGGKIENIIKFGEFLKAVDVEQVRTEAQSFLDFSSSYFIQVR